MIFDYCSLNWVVHPIKGLRFLFGFSLGFPSTSNLHVQDLKCEPINCSVSHYYSSQLIYGPVFTAPTNQIHWSMVQSRTYKWNLTATTTKPKPQGSFPCVILPRDLNLRCLV
ncbi:unnamed protein product, partial [Vitis vinifera]|uniref:Uncharacterized protein n=1 Tax=Vitis vinifera TaxID=29760 RepID=D7TSP5_VITVI